MLSNCFLGNYRLMVLNGSNTGGIKTSGAVSMFFTLRSHLSAKQRTIFADSLGINGDRVCITVVVEHEFCCSVVVKLEVGIPIECAPIVLGMFFVFSHGIVGMIEFLSIGESVQFISPVAVEFPSHSVGIGADGYLGLRQVVTQISFVSPEPWLVVGVDFGLRRVGRGMFDVLGADVVGQFIIDSVFR